VGTPEYIAPEMILLQGYGKEVDLWALGVMMYEMVLFYTPFEDDNKKDTLMNILYSQPDFTEGDFSEDLKDLISLLLVKNPTKRASISDIKQHAWFKGFDFTSLYH
jgi:serine/threonine protein kinase